MNFSLKRVLLLFYITTLLGGINIIGLNAAPCVNPSDGSWSLPILVTGHGIDVGAGLGNGDFGSVHYVKRNAGVDPSGNAIVEIFLQDDLIKNWKGLSDETIKEMLIHSIGLDLRGASEYHVIYETPCIAHLKTIADVYDQRDVNYCEQGSDMPGGSDIWHKSTKVEVKDVVCGHKCCMKAFLIEVIVDMGQMRNQVSRKVPFVTEYSPCDCYPMNYLPCGGVYPEIEGNCGE